MTHRKAANQTCSPIVREGFAANPRPAQVPIHPCRPNTPAGILRIVLDKPLAYFITFRTYGTWLHGDERLSVDRRHNVFGSPMLPASDARTRFESSELKHPPVEFGHDHRSVVDAAIRAVCAHRGWPLLALNVRSNHVHVVLKADASPERVMNSMKSWRTRRLVESGFVPEGSGVWSRHGSTIYLFRHEKVEEKCQYVTEGQDGPPQPSPP